MLSGDEPGGGLEDGSIITEGGDNLVSQGELGNPGQRMLVGYIHMWLFTETYLIARAGSCKQNTGNLAGECTGVTRVAEVTQGLDRRNRHLLLTEPRLDIGHKQSVLQELRHCDLLDLPENLEVTEMYINKVRPD